MTSKDWLNKLLGLGLKQVEIAKLIDVKEQTIKDIKRGRIKQKYSDKLETLYNAIKDEKSYIEKTRKKQKKKKTKSKRKTRRKRKSKQRQVKEKYNCKWLKQTKNGYLCGCFEKEYNINEEVGTVDKQIEYYFSKFFKESVKYINKCKSDYFIFHMQLKTKQGNSFNQTLCLQFTKTQFNLHKNSIFDECIDNMHRLTIRSKGYDNDEIIRVRFTLIGIIKNKGV